MRRWMGNEQRDRSPSDGRGERGHAHQSWIGARKSRPSGIRVGDSCRFGSVVGIVCRGHFRRTEAAGARQKVGVCTICTLLQSDWAVLGMFSGVPNTCRAWNPVRALPRAQHSPSPEGFCFNVRTKACAGAPLTLVVRASAWPPRWPVQGVCGAGSRPLAGGPGPSVCSGLGYDVPRSGAL